MRKNEKMRKKTLTFKSSFYKLSFKNAMLYLLFIVYPRKSICKNITKKLFNCVVLLQLRQILSV